jgi:tetratricopeptide (TPR) repeat protein
MQVGAAALVAAWLVAVPSIAAATPFDEAVALHLDGRAEEALAAYRRVASSPAPVEERAAALNNACVLEGELGELAAASSSCAAALRLRRELGDEGAVAETANNLGLALEAIGRAGEAAPLYAEALAINRRLGDRESVVVNLGNLGALEVAAGRYARAMELYEEAAAIAAAARDEEWAREQWRAAQVNRGVVLEKVGAYREAVAIYRELLAGEETGDPRRRAALLVNTGVIYRNLDDAVRALSALDEAIGLYDEAGDLAGLSNAHLNRGLALQLNLARPRAAEAAFRQALALARRAGDRGEEVQDLFYLGRLLLATGRLPEADTAFRQALEVATASGSAEGRWSAHEGLGRTAAARGDLHAALRELLAAVDEIERVRAALGVSSWRSGYFGDKRGAYATAVAVLVRLERAEPGRGHAARAFHVAQRAKARDLLDALGAEAARPRTASEVSASLGADTLLEYLADEERVHLWVVRRDRLVMIDLGAAPPLLAAASNVHAALAAGSAPPAAELQRLSATLLPAPALDALGRGELHVAPDGTLHYLPFELLATDTRGMTRRSSGGAPLLLRATVSYLPSGSVLVGVPRTTTTGPRPESAPRLAGFAAGEGIASTAGDGGRRRALAAAERELRMVAGLLGGRRLLHDGRRATEAAFRAALSQGPQVVHFATHAAIAEGPAGVQSAAIELHPGNGDDGRLTPPEVAAMRPAFPPRLVVLAACRTALSARGSEGRALASLTGSFLAAGAPAVVATLWDVDDAATAVVMEQLYSELARGHAPADALRRVKLRMRADPRWADPTRWAAYVVVGDGVPVAYPRRWPLIAALALAIVSVMALVWTRRPRTPRAWRP